MVVNVNIDGRAYDLGSLHTIVINHKTSDLLEKTLSNITSDCDLDIINSKDYNYEFSLLRKEMEERYYLIFRNKCKNWHSTKLNKMIKPKIIVVNLDYIKNKDLLDVEILFQSSCGSGIYIIIGYSIKKSNSVYKTILSSFSTLSY